MLCCGVKTQSSPGSGFVGAVTELPTEPEAIRVGGAVEFSIWDLLTLAAVGAAALWLARRLELL
jgi:hypothetical protein